MAATLLVLAASSAALACPACKEGVAAQGPGGGNFAAAFGYSVLFMLSMPFLLLAAFGGAFYRMCRKATNAAPPQHQREQAANPASGPVHSQQQITA